MYKCGNVSEGSEIRLNYFRAIFWILEIISKSWGKTKKVLEIAPHEWKIISVLTEIKTQSGEI